jgi:hypothetical protein
LNNNLLDNSVVFNPNPDTIAEFRILESNYSAEYGRNGGGVISVVTKSGTNTWHGSAFEFVRNDDFNANTFFNNENGLSRNVLKRNQYGGTFGGPISIPKLVNGKDRFFFFVGYQGQRLSLQNTTGEGTVFTPAQLNGDFSGVQGGFQPGNACPNADANVAAFLQANPSFQPNPASAACAVKKVTVQHPDPETHYTFFAQMASHDLFAWAVFVTYRACEAVVHSFPERGGILQLFLTTLRILPQRSTV